jgi:hypothetical protein
VRRGGGRKIEDEIWDGAAIRYRSPSPIPPSQPLKDRQHELAALFKKLGQAQQVALSFLAEHHMHKLARDPQIHADCPEFLQVQRDLAKYERKALQRLENEYKLRVESLERVYEGVKNEKETRYQVCWVQFSPPSAVANDLHRPSLERSRMRCCMLPKAAT